ncbi:Armadillo-type fold [Sesbania bispinosa]|nr:Armadillo-type fold [Sesbania bispinosa]
MHKNLFLLLLLGKRDLSSHPCFSKNALCKEQVQAVSKTLREAIELAELCVKEKTGVLGEATLPLSVSGSYIRIRVLQDTQQYKRTTCNAFKLVIWKQKHKALDRLYEVMKEDEKNVLSVLGRSNVAALVQLLTGTATSPRIREKTVTVISVGKEKATVSLQRLSMSAETTRAIVGHGGVRPLIELCQTGDSVSQAAAACALKNVSAVPEVRQALAEEGIVKVMINLLNCGILLGSKEYAAECLQNLTASNENLRRSVISEGGVRSLLAYLDGPLPQESAVGVIEEFGWISSEEILVSLWIASRLIHVLKSGSLGAQQAAASVICKVCSSMEMKKMVGEAGCIPLLVKMLEAKANSAREIAAQAIASLMVLSQNRREVKRDDKSVPNLVQLLDPSPQNTAKKYAVCCLGSLSSCKKCKKLMISYGAIGYLKKLTEMDIPGAKKLLERLERGKLRSLFSRK